MSLKDKEKWNAKYDGDSYIAGKEPCEWLKTHSGLLTEGGKALDIAAGRVEIRFLPQLWVLRWLAWIYQR